MGNKVLGLRIQTKILLVLVFIVFVPVTAILVILGIKSENEIQESHINYMLQLNEQIDHSMEMIINDAERVSLMHISGEKMSGILMKEYKQLPWEYAEDARAMTEAIKHASQLNPYIDSISFHGKNGNIYSSVGSTQDYNIYNQFQEVNWIKLLEKKDKGRFVTNLYQGRYKPLISTAKLLFAMPSMETIGYVWINLDFYSIQRVLINSLQGNKPNGFLIVQEGKVLYNTNDDKIWFDNATPEILHKLEKRNTDSDGDIFRVSVGGKEQLFAASRNDTMHWDTVQYVPVSEIQRSFFQYIRFYGIVTAFLILSALLSGGMLSLRTLKPINRLAEGMKQVANGTLNIIEGEEHRRDEMGLLIKTFNRMTLRLKESIEKEYVAQMNERKIELKMLQAQINPHFLYNTLNLITAIADLEGVQKISSISISLSDMFRYNIKGKDIVTIKDELEQIRKYLVIQELRFPNKFAVNYDLEESVYEYRILKFLLQPIVENAIYYGMEQMRGNGRVCISAIEDGDFLQIKIQDNGRGIDPINLNKIYEKLREKNEQSKIIDHDGSMGILNVHWRIQSYYGQNYGLSITSDANIGTIVSLTLPRIADERRTV